MQNIPRILVTVIMVFMCLLMVSPAMGANNHNDPNRYLDTVSQFADNVLKYGRDTYGPKHTPPVGLGRMGHG